MKRLSPICLCPYVRLRHLKRTIEALKRNPEARDSDVFFFSDAPRPGDEERVDAVRRYLRTVTGFRSVEIIERPTNDRVFNWVDGEGSLLDRFGRVISLEDDIIVAPGFLGFVNAGLDLYENDPRIFAVCGYTPAMRIEWLTDKRAYLSPRYSGWGYGYWKRSLDKVPRRIADYAAHADDPGFQSRLARMGDDYRAMLEQELDGRLDAGDVRMNYVMVRDDMRVVAPTVSLVENIGFDDSGTHCPSTQRFSVDLLRASASVVPEPGLEDDPQIIEVLRRFRSDTARQQPWPDSDLLRLIRSVCPDQRPLPPREKLGGNIIFLLGVPRSGTTLLQRLLGEHPEVHTVAEPWLLLPVCDLIAPRERTADYDAKLADQGTRNFLLELPGGEATFAGAIREMVCSLYDRCRSLGGARYFLDKTPRYHYVIEQLEQLFPDAKFVFILRNPLAVLASVADSWFSGSVDDAWKDPYHQRDLAQGPANIVRGLDLLGDKACVIRYEALATDPAPELRRLCAYLDIPFDEATLRYEPGEKFRGEFGDSIGIPKHSAPVAESLDKWVATLSQRTCYRTAKTYLGALVRNDVIGRLGYDGRAIEAQLDDSVIRRIVTNGSDADLLPYDRRGQLALDVCTQAETAFEQGATEAAVEGMVRALQIDAGCTRAASDLGAVLWAHGERELALARFEQAFIANPGDAVATLNFADALAECGREGDARSVCLRSLQADPDSSEVFHRSCMLGQNTRPAPAAASATPVTPEHFSAFAYSRRSHFGGLGLPPEHENEDLDACNLKVYQDMLLYRFVLDNFAPGARLLEIGGGDSRIIRWLKDRYEFWNLDKLEGIGNGRTSVPEPDGYVLVRDYIGAFSKELPDGHFDGVFSLSTLEHVPEDDATLAAICADIDRVLKPGGLSAHAFDIRMKAQGFWFHKLIPWLHEHQPSINAPVPPWKIRADADAWGMSRAAYEALWQPVTRQAYEDFGVPMSYNVFWRKPAAD